MPAAQRQRLAAKIREKLAEQPAAAGGEGCKETVPHPSGQEAHKHAEALRTLQNDHRVALEQQETRHKAKLAAALASVVAEWGTKLAAEEVAKKAAQNIAAAHEAALSVTHCLQLHLGVSIESLTVLCAAAGCGSGCCT